MNKRCFFGKFKNPKELFISLCLQSLATESVYSLSGMEPEGITYMEAYTWNGNYKHFRRVIDMPAESSSVTYLRTEAVLAALETEKAIDNSHSLNTEDVEINIDQQLNGIICDVIKLLLKRDGMTKTVCSRSAAPKIFSGLRIR